MARIATFALLAVCIALAVALDTVPGAGSISAGYDVVKGEGGLSPVFKYHNDAKKTFFNPYNNVTYSVPDEIDITMLGHVRLDSIQSIVEHYELFLKSVFEASWTGISIGIPGLFGLAFKYSKEMGEVHSRLKDKMHAMAHGIYSYDLYEVVGTMPEFMELDDTFSSFLDVLPKTISTADDQQLYNQMIDSFGTHVAYRTVMGGKAHLNTFLHQDYLSKKDSKWVAEQLSFSFQYKMFDIGMKYFHNKTEIHVDKDFEVNSETQSFFYGGNPAYHSEGTEKEWLASIVEMPYALNATLEPIWSIIPDPTIANNVKQAVMYYAKHNHLPTAPLHESIGAVMLTMAGDELNPIPGADYVGHGVDESNLGVPLKPVVDFTYNRHTIYQNPVYPELRWKVPDQIPAVVNTPESMDMNGTFIFDEVEDYVKWTYSSSSSSGMFHSHSKSTTTFYERYYEKDEAMSLSLKEYSWYALTMPPFPPPQPSAALKGVLARMPATYSSDHDKKLWSTFISVYGTAFYTKAVLGGSMKMQTWFHKCFLTENSGKWVSEQSGWSILHIIGHGHAKKVAETHIDKDFNEYHQTDIEFVGGDQTVPADQWEAWVKTIKRAPAPVESTLMPFETLLVGPYARLVNAFKAARADHEAAIAAANKADAAKYHAAGDHTDPSWCHPRR